MTHDLDKIITNRTANIINNIRIANELITTLKKYIDTSDHRNFFAKLMRDFIGLRDLNHDQKITEMSKLIVIDINLMSLCNDMRRCIDVQEFNHNSFNGILAYSPEMIDTVIKNIPQQALHIYMCLQSKLILNMLEFCNTAKLGGVKIFDLFNENDITYKWLELYDIKKGLCFGLSSLFLLCSFVSDMQQNKLISSPEDDLRWFYRCVILLQLRHYEYSSSQKKDITRFISLVIHLQNNNVASGLPNGVFHSVFPPGFIQQGINFRNAEFSGANFIAYEEYAHYQDTVFLDALLRYKSGLYIQFGLHDHPNPGHAVSLHKSPAGMFTFYDPSVRAENIELKDEKDFLAFKNRCLVNKQNTVTVTMGRAMAKTPPCLPEESPQELVSSKKRLRIGGS